MVLQKLGQSLINALSGIFKKDIITEDDLKDLIKKICTSLAEADVDSKIVLDICTDLKNDIILTPIPPGQNIFNVVYGRIYSILFKRFNVPEVANFGKIIMFVGLQGAGKTTSVGKFAFYFKQRGVKVGVIAGDLFRAGAIAQLKQLCSGAGISCFSGFGPQDPEKTVEHIQQGIKFFNDHGFDMILIDTSGRHKQCDALLKEMGEICEVVKPSHTIFVLDSTIGQSAKDQIIAFKDIVKIGSFIITKLDSGAKGGGALTAISTIGCPISFIGTGEHIGEFDKFVPETFVKTLLGKGDLHQAYKVMTETATVSEDGINATSKLFKGGFNLRDFAQMISEFENMGSFSSIISMLPGSNMIDEKNKKFSTSYMKRCLVILDSATPEELDHPDLLLVCKSRKNRIAKGSGSQMIDVEKCLALYKMMINFSKTKDMKGILHSIMSGKSEKQSRLPGNMGNLLKTFGKTLGKH